MQLCMFLNKPICQKMRMITLQDYGEPGDEIQDYEIKAQDILPCTMLVDSTVKNKTPSWLVHIILDSSGTITMII